MNTPARRVVGRESELGTMLRGWRELRRLSQLDLALEAEVSARHLSFIETGRARPSREMVLTLANVLEIPLRDRNALLHAAGFASVYRETPLTDPSMTQVLQALTLILKQQEPFGALVFDRRCNVVMVNAAFAEFSRMVFGAAQTGLTPLTIIAPPRPNLLHTLLDPAGWRPYLVNWESVAKAMLARLHRVAMWNRDAGTLAVWQAALAYPGVPARWREPEIEPAQAAFLPLEFRFGEHTLRLFSTITTLGSPQDITLQELSIEAFHPVDEATARFARELSRAAAARTAERRG